MTDPASGSRPVSAPSRAGSLERAVVTRFSDSEGLGDVTTPDGETLPFHCIDIADGTRSIDEGTGVLFLRRIGHLGADCATEVTPATR